MICSVIIPTYNRLDLLQSTLESVFAQDLPVGEVIVIDDGSSDGTQEYLDSLGRKIRWMAQEHRGPGAARNRGMELARGEWFAFLDSDDLWFPWTWRRYADVIGASGAGLLFGNPLHFSEPTALAGLKEPRGKPQWQGFSDYYQSSDMWRWWGASSLLIRRQFAESARFVERPVNGEDADFLMQVGAEVPLAQVTGEPTFCYREHTGSVMKDFAKTVAGARNLVDTELSGRYPGGEARCRERRRILGRHLRPVILDLLRGRSKSDGWRLFNETFSWHVKDRRWRFIAAATAIRFLK